MEISENLINIAKSYFDQRFVQTALRLVSTKRVTTSFVKGDMDSYLICSGIVRDGNTHECKFTYKAKEKDSEAGPLKTTCNCSAHKEFGRCSHTATLFLYYLIGNQKHSTNDNNLFPTSNYAFSNDHAVYVEEFGTILAGPGSLEGANSGNTYSTLSYLLTNRKVIHFPSPVPFRGKLSLNIITSLEGEDGEINYLKVPMIRFSYIGEDGKEVREVSLFENLYIFNWSDGTAYNIPRELKDIIQKLRFSKRFHSPDELVNFCTQEKLEETLILRIDGVLLSEVPIAQVNSRLSVKPSEKKGFLTITLNFHDANEVVRKPPKVLKELTFTNGFFGSFRRKKDAYDFMKDLSIDLMEETEISKRHLHQITNKERLGLFFEDVFSKNDQKLYDERRKQIHIIDYQFIKSFICRFVESFSETSFRFSEYYDDRQELEYVIPTNTFLNGISGFYQTLNHLGLSLYYDKIEVRKWNSRIRFERKTGTTKWFDLDLKISKEDLEVITSADLEQGTVLTKNGLILLSQEQKDLIRFMKKYTKFEGKEENQDEAPEEEKEEFKRFSLPFQRARIFELFELKKLGIEGALTEEEEELCHKLASLEKMPEFPLPDKLKDVLRPYQQTGYQWLNFLYEYRLGACLADDMGLGKTLQAIAFIEKNYDQFEKVLIVCPVSILLNWEKEFQKFSNVDISIYHGGARKIDPEKKVILTSYGVMKKEHDTTFKDYHFDVLILDEVQHLKNIRSLGAYAARSINADFRICLTGTPVENDLSEFYNILDLCVPGVWGNLEFVRTVSNKKSRLLARKTARPFILRRTKSQVLTELPPKSENNVFLSFNNDEQKNYQDLLKGIKSKIILSPSNKKYGEILKGILELRKNCLWQKSQAIHQVTRQPIQSTKIDFLIENLNQIKEEGHKAIVFSQFTTYLDHIQRSLHELHYKIARIDGSQSIKKRQEQVDYFQDGEAEVFLISLKAGGVGLNLTAASYVFLMDPWWNPAVESQAIDRAHRIGQKNTLTVYRPIIQGSVEEKVLELQRIKRELFLDLLPDTEDQSYFTGKLTMKDFEQLLE